MDSQEILQSLTSEACISLFSDYSLPLHPAEQNDQPFEPELLFCSVIGFSSDQMRGTLVLATTREPLPSGPTETFRPCSMSMSRGRSSSACR